MRKSPQERLNELTQVDLPLWEAGRAFAGIDEAGRALSSGSPPVLLWNMGRKRKERVFNAPSFYPFLATFKMKESSPALTPTPPWRGRCGRPSGCRTAWSGTRNS